MREPGRTWAPRAAEGSVVTGSATDGGDRRSGAGGSAGTGTTPYRDVCHPGRTGQCGAGGFFCSPPELRDGGDPSVSGLCAGFGSSGVPTGGRSPARDRKSGVSGKRGAVSVDHGDRRLIKKQKQQKP